MALRQVGARTEGDVIQGLFFWREAAALLIPNSRVRQVSIEHDEASGVDDVAVFYEESGVDAGGWFATADFYQVKYHVDRRKAYTADALMDWPVAGFKDTELGVSMKPGGAPWSDASLRESLSWRR